MTSNYQVNGVDLDTLLAPLHSGWPTAGATNDQVAGTDLDARYAPLSTGTAPAITNYQVAGVDLSEIFAAYGSTGVQVLTQPSNVSGSSAAGNPSGTVTSASATCAFTKGGGTYTYEWTCNGCTATDPTSATTTFYATVDAGATAAATAYCTGTDGVTSVNTNTISVSLQNTSASFVSAQYTYSSGSGSQAVPDGATNAVIELWGVGGPGGYGTGTQKPDIYYGPGGQAGGYCRSSYSCSGGQTLNYALSAAYATDSTVTSGTLSITTMTAVGGGEGGVTGYGTASGGNAANTTGALGGPGGSTASDGAGGAGTVGVYEGAEGGGGNGGYGAGVAGSPGQSPFVSFYFTA